MVKRTAIAQRNADHRLLRGCRRLADRFRNFASLAMTEPGAALAVTNDDQCCKTETLAALHGLGNAVDVDELLDELLAALIVAPASAPIVTAPAAATVTAATTTSATGTASASTASARGFSLACRLDFRLRLIGGSFGHLRSFVFVSHHQNSNPPSRAASASAFTRP
jgi:hypothetical protein